MYCIDEVIMKQFFYNGIEDTQELIEGIIFFANSEMHKLYANLREQYDASNTKQLLQMKNIAYKCGLQYYRFIELNKDTSRLVNYKTENESQKVKQIIDQTIEDIINRKSLIEYKVGYFYCNSESSKFLSKYPKGDRMRKFWAIEVSEQLNQLSIQEKENPIDYYRTWINVRLKNALLKKHNIDISQLEWLNYMKEKLEERIKLLEKKEEEQINL